MKKIALLLTAVLLTATFTGCTKKTASDSEFEAKTKGTKLAAEFKKEIKQTTDLIQIAETLAESSDMICITQEMEPGYFPGFDEEITGFKQAVGFLPMIGTIPFVGYVFKTSDPVSLLEKLEATHDLRWNICTEADIVFSAINDKYLMFVMSPADKTEDALENNDTPEILVVEENSGENTTVE